MNSRPEQVLEHEIDPLHAETPGHGNSVAAWACIGVMFLGVLVGAISFALYQPVGVYVGIAIIIVGLLVGWAMAKAGYGVGGHKSKGHH